MVTLPDLDSGSRKFEPYTSRISQVGEEEDPLRQFLTEASSDILFYTNGINVIAGSSPVLTTNKYIEKEV